MRATLTSSGGLAVRRLLRLLSILFTGTLVSSAFAFITQLLLARLLLPVDFGRFAALLATANFFTPVAAGGMNWFLVQAFGREGWDASRWLRPAAQLIFLYTGLSAAALGFYAARSFGSAGLPAALAAIAILIGQVAVELASARLQLTGNFGGLALWQAVTQTGRLLALAPAALLPMVSPAAVLGGYALVGLLTTAIGVLLLAGLWTRRAVLSGYGRFQSGTMPASSIGRTALEAGPYALVTMFYVLYFQGAVVVLEWLKGGEAAAQYNAAFLVLSAISLIPQVIYTKLLMAPLCRWAVHDRRTFEAAFYVGVVAMGVVGLVLLVATTFSAHWVMALLFGQRYMSSAPVLAVLALSIPVRFIQSAYSSVFISRQDTARKARYLGAAALVATGASVCLVPSLGIQGAAVATVLAEATLLVLHVRGTSRYIEGISVRDTARISTLRAALRHLSAQARHANI